MAKDPINRLEKHLLKEKIADKAVIREYRERIQKEVDDAVEFARKSPVPPLEVAMQDVFID